MGLAHYADNIGTERDLSRPHVPDERIDHGNQGHTVFPLRATHRSPVGRVGPQVLSVGDGVLHMCPDPAHDYQYLVVLRDDQHQRSVRGHVFDSVRVRG